MNKALAHAFSYMNLVEAWGSGIPKLMEVMNDYGLQEPEFVDMEIGFRINLYRKKNVHNVSKSVHNVSKNVHKRPINESNNSENDFFTRLLMILKQDRKLLKRFLVKNWGDPQNCTESVSKVAVGWCYRV